MNLARLNRYPDAIKILELLLVIMTLLFAGVAEVPEKAHPSGRSFFWFNMTIQCLGLFIVIVLFVLEKEDVLLSSMMPFSRLEFGYASLFSLLSLINMIITMTWLNYSFDGKLGISALFCFTSMFVYGINAVIAFKTFNGNGAFLNHQEGSGQIVGGDIENMHSGI